MQKATEEFAGMYWDQLLEVVAEGCSGGLYGDFIEVEEGQEGVFDASTIQKFIRFQHGDNDYHSDFSNREEDALTSPNGIKELAEAFLKMVNMPAAKEEHYVGVFPHIIDNMKESLNRIIES